MSHANNLTTNSLLGCSAKMNYLNAMTATIGLGLQIQKPCGVIFSRAMLHHHKSLFIPRSNQTLVSATNYGQSLLLLVQKNPKYSLHRGSPCCMSIDVEKEGNSSVDMKMEKSELSSSDVGTENNTAEPSKIPRAGLEETFAVLNTGKYECTSCGYVYDQSLGDPLYPVAPGLEFSRLPEDWRCPTCGAAKSYFNSKSIEVAGFAQNQQFGFGGNTLTSGQKSALIYGSLLFFFALFLLGYFLQ